MKVKFPLATVSDTATYEIPFGAIARSTNPRSEAEKAKWEVPALRWGDIGDKQFGVSVLTNAKHGFDADQSHLRLTLLKSPIWPDPNADKGWHHFSYAIYPHSDTWQNAHTVRHAREFSIAPTTFQPNDTALNSHGITESSFFEIHNANIIMSALKPSEDNSEEFILRCYEAHGEASNIETESSLDLSISSEEQAHRTDLLENSTTSLDLTSVKPWQVSTYRLKRKNSANY